MCMRIIVKIKIKGVIIMTARKRAVSETKTSKIDMRVTKGQKAEITVMAESIGLSVSSYLLLCHKMLSSDAFKVPFDLTKKSLVD